MTGTFGKGPWLLYVDSGESYYKLASLEEQYALLCPRRSLTQSVDFEANVNVASNVDESYTDVVPEGDED